MKCFHDPTQDAVGLCRACGKALCRDHLVDFDKGLACKGHCEDLVLRMIALNDMSLELSAESKGLLRASGLDMMVRAVLLIILGAAFLGFSMVYYEETNPFLVGIGAAIAICGLAMLVPAIFFQRRKGK
jgi:hypothetical protein